MGWSLLSWIWLKAAPKVVEQLPWTRNQFRASTSHWCQVTSGTYNMLLKGSTHQNPEWKFVWFGNCSLQKDEVAVDSVCHVSPVPDSRNNVSKLRFLYQLLDFRDFIPGVWGLTCFACLCKCPMQGRGHLNSCCTPSHFSVWEGFLVTLNLQWIPLQRIPPFVNPWLHILFP